MGYCWISHLNNPCVWFQRFTRSAKGGLLQRVPHSHRACTEQLYGSYACVAGVCSLRVLVPPRQWKWMWMAVCEWCECEWCVSGCEAVIIPADVFIPCSLLSIREIDHAPFQHHPGLLRHFLNSLVLPNTCLWIFTEGAGSSKTSKVLPNTRTKWTDSSLRMKTKSSCQIIAYATWKACFYGDSHDVHTA